MVDSNIPVGGGYGVYPTRENVPGASSTSSASDADAVSFEDVLRDSIKNVDKLQSDASEAIQKVSTGDADSVAEVMTAVEKADIAFRSLMQIRNKLVDAYEELLRKRH